MKEKLLRALKWCAYPAFYFFALLAFTYLTFPVDRLKDRILSEVAKQSKGKAPPTITIDKLDTYWLTGVHADGVKIRIPADGGSSSSSKSAFPGMPPGFGMGSGDSEPAKDTVIDVKELHARARLLPMLIGRVQLDFWASVFGGEVSGSAPVNNTKGDVDLKIEDLKLSEAEPLQSLLGIPIDGKVNGAVDLSPADGKLSKGSGKVELSIKGVVVGDGKTKLMGLLALPPAKVDEIALTGEADKGVLKITKLSANGPDLELEGDGRVNLSNSVVDSNVDIYVKFRFTDAYRGKDATTKSLLGDPGSSMSGLIDQAPKLKKAKRPDGFYGFHIKGKLKALTFEPSPTDLSGSSGTSSGASGSKKGKGAGDSTPPLGPGKKIGGVSLPLGMSSSAPGRDKKDGDGDSDDKKKALGDEKREEKREEKKDDKPEEKADDRPPADRLGASPLQLRPVPPPSPEPEPPANNPPPPPAGDTPGTDQPPPPPPPQGDRPTEEPR